MSDETPEAPMNDFNATIIADFRPNGGKVGPPFELQISRLEPDRLWSEVGTAGPFTAYGTLLFEDETREGTGAPGTRVRCIARVQPLG